jgi:hypothetical protein
MPLSKFELTSPLSVEEALECLKSLSRERGGFARSLKGTTFLTSVQTPPFIGRVEGNRFRFRRAIRYRNAFLPYISGSLHPAPSGTVVRVTIAIHPFVAAFMAVWFGGVGFAFVVSVMHMNGDISGPLLASGMLAFGVGLTAICFYPEAHKARRILEDTLGASGT